jgi:branched-subunit amino acid ABC-type transport system permease component
LNNLLLGVGFGLVTASILALSAVALSLQYSVTNVPNFAHGELMTVGAYAAYVAQQSTHSIPIEIIAAVLTGGALGFSINFFLLQPFVKRGARNLTLFVLTISMSIIVQSALQFIFTGANVAFTAPSEKASQIGPFLLTAQSQEIILSALGVMIVLYVLIKYTKFGKAQRAVADSRELARMTGINAAWIVHISWLISGLIAGFAGYVLATSIGSFGAQFGFGFLLPTFAAAILGGIGKPNGAVLGALVVGVSMEISALYIPPNYKQSVAFVLLIITLLVRPNGILGVIRAPQTGQAA